MKKVAALGVFLVLANIPIALSQVPEKEIHHREQVWLGYFSQTRFTNRLGVWMDVHYRMTDHVTGRPFQFLFRPALTYSIKENLRINAGYVLAEHFRPAGLWILSPGFSHNINDDHEQLALGMKIQDALYSWAKYVKN